MRVFLFIFFLFTISFFFCQDSISDKLEWDKTNKNTKELNDLLSDPLNLQFFKKLKPQHSNSGGANKFNYYYKPNYNGFYYRYFVFRGFTTDGPHIITYKKGMNVSGYMDTSEVFIQLSSDMVDKDLGKINLLSFSKTEILKKFGNNYLSKGNTLIYQYNKTLLIYTSLWFKVVRTNKTFKNFSEIENAKDLLKPF